MLLPTSSDPMCVPSIYFDHSVARVDDMYQLAGVLGVFDTELSSTANPSTE